MADHTDLGSPEPRGSLASSVFTRRTALRTAAWTAPVVSVVVAAPAYAAGTVPAAPTLAVSWDVASFRASSLANGNTGTPVASGTYAYSAINLVVTGGALSRLVITAASAAAGNGIAIQNLSQTGNRSGTTWATGNGDLTPYVVSGGTLAPSSGASAQFATWTFQRSTAIPSTLAFKVPWTSIGATDVPITYVVQGYYNPGAGDTALPMRTVTITNSATSPFWTGTVS